MKRAAALPPLPRRRPESHKGTYGRVLLLCGSEGMTGAAILAARAAYRAGVGLVTVGIDRALFSSVSPAVPEAVFLDASDWARLLTMEALSGFDAVLVGPGLGAAGHDLSFWAIENRAGPLVVDADALNAIASEPQRLLKPRADRVWTPHPGEFARLTGEKPRGDAARVRAVRSFVQAHGGVLVLKGHRTVVADRKRHAINETGNAGMATAGAGDVLAGMIAAFLGQGMAPFDAALAGVHIHGRAGDRAARDLGEIPLVAGDLIEYLPRAIQEYGAPE